MRAPWRAIGSTGQDDPGLASIITLRGCLNAGNVDDRERKEEYPVVCDWRKNEDMDEGETRRRACNGMMLGTQIRTQFL